MLKSVTVSYGNATQQFETARMNELARNYGVNDGGEAMTWHRKARGAQITLFRDRQNSALTETYTLDE